MTECVALIFNEFSDYQSIFTGIMYFLSSVQKLKSTHIPTVIAGPCDLQDDDIDRYRRVTGLKSGLLLPFPSSFGQMR